MCCRGRAGRRGASRGGQGVRYTRIPVHNHVADKGDKGFANEPHHTWLHLLPRTQVKEGGNWRERQIKEEKERDTRKREGRGGERKEEEENVR